MQSRRDGGDGHADVLYVKVACSAVSWCYCMVCGCRLAGHGIIQAADDRTDRWTHQASWAEPKEGSRWRAFSPFLSAFRCPGCGEVSRNPRQQSRHLSSAALVRSFSHSGEPQPARISRPAAGSAERKPYRRGRPRQAVGRHRYPLLQDLARGRHHDDQHDTRRRLQPYLPAPRFAHTRNAAARPWTSRSSFHLAPHAAQAQTPTCRFSSWSPAHRRRRPTSASPPRVPRPHPLRCLVVAIATHAARYEGMRAFATPSALPFPAACRAVC